MRTYQIAETFISPQGEGVYSGTIMAFIRFVGCTVGKKICHSCDTDFDRMYEWNGGGEFTAEKLVAQFSHIPHWCFTGGEPLAQQELVSLLTSLDKVRVPSTMLHIETSGTIVPLSHFNTPGVWFSMSPKPGFLEEALTWANEIKVIVPGLGNGPGWPTINDALRWADENLHRPVFLQPKNEKNSINRANLDLCMELALKYPQLRVSPQFHKYMAVR